MQAFKCDKCKKMFDDMNALKIITIKENDGKEQKYDLCTNCYRTIEKNILPVLDCELCKYYVPFTNNGNPKCIVLRCCPTRPCKYGVPKYEEEEL